MKPMNTLDKALITGIVSWIAIALILHLVKGVDVVQAVTDLYTIVMAVTAVAGSYIGFQRKAMRSAHLVQ